jgi:sulfate adenylyltransferase subunit 1
LPLQYVAKEGDGTGHQRRTLWGRIAQGQVQLDDTVQVFPSGEHTQVVALRRADEDVTHAEAGQSAGVVLDRQLDVSRGDWIGAPGTLAATQRFGAPGLARYRTGSDRPRGLAAPRQPLGAGAHHRDRPCVDIHTLALSEAHQLAVNEIGHVIIETQHALPLQRYADNRVGGALIVVDATSNRTSGALLVEGVRA